MNRILLMRVARRAELFSWCMLFLFVAMHVLGAYVLPGMIARWMAEGRDVAPWIRQIPIDAAYMLRHNLFTGFPLLFLIAVGTSYYAWLDRRNRAISVL